MNEANAKKPDSMQSCLACTEIAVKLVKFDDSDYPRARIDQEAVDEYAREMEAGTEFPAIDVFLDGGFYWLADGRHRLEACRKIGREKIRARLYQGKRRDAILHALQANADYGVRRTSADKRKAVAILLKDPDWSKWNDSEIARECRVSAALVKSVRGGADNGAYPKVPEVGEGRMVRRGDSVYPMKPPRPKAEVKVKENAAGSVGAKMSQEDAAAAVKAIEPADRVCASVPDSGNKLTESLCRVSAGLHKILAGATEAAEQMAAGLRKGLNAGEGNRKDVEETTAFARKLLAGVSVKVGEAQVALDELHNLLDPESTDADRGRRKEQGKGKGGKPAQAGKPAEQEPQATKAETGADGRTTLE